MVGTRLIVRFLFVKVPLGVFSLFTVSKKYPFTEQNVNNSPDKPGVYILYDGDEVIDIGQSEESIRGRLQDHLRGDHGPCTQGATHYMREENSDPVAREEELLRQFRRRHGRLPRCNKRIG
jgi:hypothetical protein